jgi:SAM-dependent methyltransferase
VHIRKEAISGRGKKFTVMPPHHMVRGYGPLDSFLAKQRYKIATRQIELAKKNGRILDIGCGSYPLFLLNVDFTEKYGLDKMVETATEERTKQQEIILISHDIENEEKLPFEDNFFDVVSMLAVFEHIEPNKLVKMHREIYRTLKPGGIYIMTTPAFWTDCLLRLLAKSGLITDIEIREHKGSYSHSMISCILQEAYFQRNKLRFGYFELFMNIWATATK